MTVELDNKYLMYLSEFMKRSETDILVQMMRQYGSVVLYDHDTGGKRVLKTDKDIQQARADGAIEAVAKTT